MGEKAGIIGAGKFDIKPITIATVQTLSRKKEGELKKISEHFGQMIFDECHHTPCKSFLKVLDSFDCNFVLGLSATPYRKDKLDKLIFAAMGGIVAEVTNDDLKKANRRVGLKVVKRETQFDYDYFEDLRGLKSNCALAIIMMLKKGNKGGMLHFNKVTIADIIGWEDDNDREAMAEIRHFMISKRHLMIDDLIQDLPRNKMIVRDILREYNQGNISLVLTDRVEHCKILAKMLNLSGASRVRAIFGKTKKKEREEIIDGVNKGRFKVIIATGQLAGEGLDIPILSRLFIAMPISWRGRIEQYVGRVLRVVEGKEIAKVYDYVDKNIGSLLNSFKNRQKVYSRFE